MRRGGTGRIERTVTRGTDGRDDESVKKNGVVPPSLGGNALEAILGAIYLDLPVAHRLDQVRRLALAWLQPEMEHLAETWGHRQAKQNLQK